MKQTKMVWVCALVYCVVAVMLYSGPAAAQAPPGGPPPVPGETATATPTPTLTSPPVPGETTTATPTPTPSQGMRSATEDQHVNLVCLPNHAGRPLAICSNGDIHLFGAPSYELIQIADGIVVVTSYADGKPYVFILRGDEVEIVQW